MVEAARLRIAYVLPQLNRAGTQKQVVALASAMSQRGHLVSVIILEDGRAMADDLPREVDLICSDFDPRVRAASNLWAVVRLTKQLKKIRPNIIHSYLLWPNVWGAIAACFIPGATLITSRRGLAHYKTEGSLITRIEDLTNLRASTVVANAKAVQIDTEYWEPRARGNVKLIYNGIRTREQESAHEKEPSAEDLERLRRENGASAGDTVLVSVANLHQYKGHDDLLDTMKILKDKDTRVILWMIGEDRGYEKAIRSKIEALGLEQEARLLGRRDDVEALLPAADIGLLCPSLNEGLSNALLEYMIWGMPAVVTDVGGNAECVADGENGFVIPVARPDLLADRIRRLIESPELCRAFGLDAKARVRRMFDKERMVDEHEQLYYDLTSST
jgi:glycosyltransferase involved in cell wall biosynthesis